MSKKNPSSTTEADPTPADARNGSGVVPKMGGRRAPLGAPTVLVVEPQAPVRAALCEQLCMSYFVLDTADPFAAVGLCMRFQPDLVLAAAHMPGLDGGPLAELLGRALADQAPPLVLLAASGAAVDCGRDTRVLVLPVAPPMLLDTLERVLADR